MRNLVRRYVTVEQRKAENQGVTEDDVNEIKQDISAFRCELVEILKNSGMNTSTAAATGQGILPRGSKLSTSLRPRPGLPLSLSSVHLPGGWLSWGESGENLMMWSSWAELS